MPQYLTTEELSARIKFDPRYIRERLKGRVFREGIHSTRPFLSKLGLAERHLGQHTARPKAYDDLPNPTGRLETGFLDHF